MAVYLLRHADSSPAEHTAEPEWPLSTLGIKQSKALIPVLSDLNIDVIYSSPYRRALATIAPFAAAANLDIKKDQRLSEKKLTDQWLDDHIKAIRKSWDDFDFCYPEGESNRACQQRVVRAIREIRNRQNDQNIIISSHGNAISLCLNNFDSSFGYDEWKAMPKPALFRIEIKSWNQIKLPSLPSI